MQNFFILAQQPNGGAYLIGMLIGLGIGLTIGLFIGAVILRAACGLVNKVIEEPIDEPEYGKAILIVFVRLIAQVCFGFAIGLIGGILSGGQPNPAIMLAIQGVSFIVGFLVSAGIYTAMIPTPDYGKGLLVAFFEFLIVLAIVIVIGGVILAITAATGGFGR